MKPLRLFPVLAVATLLISPCPLAAEDWPRWRGPNLDGISREQGWSTTWPKEGPPVLWRAQVGIGFSSFSVSQGRAYTLGNTANQDTVFCFDAEKGALLWKHTYPCALLAKYYEGGPGSTPTLDGAEVYTLSKMGHLFCFAADTGKILWQRDLVKEHGVAVPQWGFAGSPLVDGIRLILNVGTSGMAVDKRDGKLIWLTGKEAAAYSTPVPFVENGKEAVAIFAGKAVVALDRASGREFWRQPWKTNYDINSADPILSGNRVFLSSGYGAGGGLFEINQGVSKEVWRNKHMRNQINSCVLIGGHLYGISGQDGSLSNLACEDLATGELKWSAKAAGFGSVTAADGKLIVLSDKGELMVAPASPAGFNPVARAQVLNGKCWTTPVLANGRIYCRNAAGSVVCLDVRPR
jgi:outer membrane protein assembly factor BamB